MLEHSYLLELILGELIQTDTQTCNAISYKIWFENWLWTLKITQSLTASTQITLQGVKKFFQDIYLDKKATKFRLIHNEIPQLPPPSSLLILTIIKVCVWQSGKIGMMRFAWIRPSFIPIRNLVSHFDWCIG